MRAFDAWLKSISKTPRTGLAWERAGWITVMRINGRKYIRDEEIERFFREGAQRAQRPNPGWFGQRAA